MTFFHKSNPFFRENILKEGLLPQIGPSYLSHYEEKNMGAAVFVCLDKNYDTTYDDDIYKISLSDEEYEIIGFNTDFEVENSLYTKNAIPPKNIQLIYSGTGNSTF